MNESQLMTVFAVVIMFASVLYLVGLHNGTKNWYVKPCNQFVEWQYQQGQVPARCVRTLK